MSQHVPGPSQSDLATHLNFKQLWLLWLQLNIFYSLDVMRRRYTWWNQSDHHHHHHLPHHHHHPLLLVNMRLRCLCQQAVKITGPGTRMISLTRSDCTDPSRELLTFIQTGPMVQLECEAPGFSMEEDITGRSTCRREYSGPAWCLV